MLYVILSNVSMLLYDSSKIKNGFEYDELFELNDFVPTFADMAGMPIPDDIDGDSFYSLFTSQEQVARERVLVDYDPLKAGEKERWYG